LVQAAGETTTSEIIHSTLDLYLQRRVQAIVLSHRARLQKGGISQAAAVIIKNRPMEVMALVGSFHYEARDQGFNNGAAAKRSPGSTLKPFLYAQALDLGYNPARVLEDVNGRYRTPRGEFIPANFDRVAHGPISMREALGNSLNLSAVHLINQVGPPVFYDLLTRLQLINYPERPAEHYGLGLVVGNPEVSLLQLATAFASLANGGVYRPVKLIKAEEAEGSPEPIFSPQAAYIISDILADPMARARTFGASLAMNPDLPVAIKTGTSTRYRDCWAVGYTPEYTLAVWTGNFDGRPTAKMSGASASAPILADLAAAVLPSDRTPGFSRPTGVASQEICSFSGMRPGPSCLHRRRELFIAGTEPEAVCTYHHSQEPWHRMPTRFAGWLHDRFEHRSAGRYRLAGFDTDLERTFGEPDPAESMTQSSVLSPQHSNRVKGASGQPSHHNNSVNKKLSLGHNPILHLHHTLFPALAAHKDPQVSITAPLPGDRFLVPPGQDAVTLSLKAACRAPFPQVTWFIDGREYAATGPPYELSLPLGRGRHRLTVIGPDGLGDNLEVSVE
jgi:penicillin-binding protein 1C